MAKTPCTRGAGVFFLVSQKLFYAFYGAENNFVNAIILIVRVGKE